ncbi:hypothetical protein [Burkholderia gladioli]|uniref:hypothetical protein n=1 Tax=Burkholderia gladioli TaxID=28095 RepID=UPI00164219E3|nr:hypothetical protein [Burkholderia gladioli]
MKHQIFGRMVGIDEPLIVLTAGLGSSTGGQANDPGRAVGTNDIALKGGLVWLKLALTWKWSEWSTIHDVGGVVLQQLLASGVTLLGVSALAGCLTPRVDGGYARRALTCRCCA